MGPADKQEPVVDEPQKKVHRERLLEVDRVTAVAILLVVFGHLAARQPPQDAQWYVDLKFLIYQFHMPLFMFCSGLVFRYVYTTMTQFQELGGWIAKKAYRLLPAFVIIGLAIIFGKIASSYFIHVDNRPTDLIESFYLLVFYPKLGAAGSLWYIYVLFEFYVLFPLIFLITRNNTTIVLLAATLMHVLHLAFALPRFMMLDAVFEYALYFSLGGLAAIYYKYWLKILKHFGWASVAVFLMSFNAVLFLDEIHSKTIVGLTSIPALTYLVGTRGSAFDKSLLFVGSYTFAIYLMNTIFIGLTKGLMLKITPWDGVNFYFYAPILMIAGVAGPILTYRWILSWNEHLRRMFN